MVFTTWTGSVGGFRQPGVALHGDLAPLVHGGPIYFKRSFGVCLRVAGDAILLRLKRLTPHPPTPHLGGLA
eukprot:5418903-Pyramimonas_sp.AAC.1